MIKLNYWPFKRRSSLLGPEIFDLLIESIYLATIFLIPLWFAYWFPTYNIFELNKFLLFQILVCLLLLATGLKYIFYPRRLSLSWGWLFKKYWLSPIIFIIGLSLALLSSGDPVRSFYGSIERQAGLVSYLFYFIWFILLTVNVLTVSNVFHASAVDNSQDNLSQRLKRIAITATISSFIVSIYGILQILNIDFLTWTEAPFLTYRTISTFGQPNFLASWLLLAMPLSFYLFKTSRRFLVKFFYLLVGAAQISCLFLTGSRGGFLALIFGLVLFSSYKLYFCLWPKRKKFLVFSGAFLAVIFILAGFNYISQGRALKSINFREGSVAARINLYQAATQAIAQRPLFGYGLENSSEVFIKYYNAQWGLFGDVGQSADRAHNLVLDTLLSLGIYGALLYLGLYYFIGQLVWQNLNNKKLDLTAVLALGILMYLFSLLFSFSIVAGEVYLWLFFALLLIVNASQRGLAGQPLNLSSPSKNFYFLRSKLISYLIKLIVSVVLVSLVTYQISRALANLAADYYFDQVDQTLIQSDYFTALVLYDYLLAKKPNPINQQAYDNFLGDKLSDVLPSAQELVIRKVVADKLKALDRSLPPAGYNNLLVKAKINRVLKNFSVAQIYLDKLVALSPFWPLAYLERGRLAADRNLPKEALISDHLALLNLPDPADERLNEEHRQVVHYFEQQIYEQMAEVFQAQNNEAAAEKYYQLAYESNPADFTLFKKIADTYYRRANLGEAIKYNLRGLSRDPGDYHWALSLAVLYRENSNPQEANYYLNRALKLVPDNPVLLNLKSTWRPE